MAQENGTRQNYYPFYGGMGDNKFISNAGKGQCNLMQNLDMRTDTRVLQLGRKPEFEVTISKKPNVFLDDPDGTGRIYSLCDDGYIYEVISGNRVYIATNTTDINNGIFFNDAFVWVHQDLDVSRILSTGINDTSRTTGITESFYSLTDGGINAGIRAVPMLNFYNSFLYIGSGSKIFKIDRSWNGSEALDVGDYIVGITSYGGLIRIYTRNGGQAFWNGVSDAVDSRVYRDNDIRYVKNDGPTDYVFCGKGTASDLSSIWISSGQERRLLKRAQNNSDQQTGLDYDFFVDETSESSVAITDGILYFPGKEVLYAFGSKYDGIPKGYDIPLTSVFDNLGDEYSMNQINSISGSRSGKTYIGASVGSAGNYVINQFDQRPGITPEYSAEGTYITNKVDGFDMSEPKNALKLQLGKDITSGDSIEVYSRIDSADSGDRVLEETLTGDGKKVITINKTFYYIDFKLVLKSSDGSTTPCLYDMKLLYEYQQRQGL